MGAGRHVYTQRRQAANRRTARRRYLVLLGLLAAVLSLLYIAVLSTDIVAAKKLLFQGKTELRTAAEMAKNKEFDMSGHYFKKARGSFSDASNILGRPSVRAASLLPIVHENISTVSKLASAGTEVAEAGYLLSQATAGLSVNGDTFGFDPVGAKLDLKPFVTAQAYARAASSHTLRAVQEYEEAPHDWLIGTVKDARQEFGKELEKLTGLTVTVNQLLDVLPSLSGEQGQRRYFLAIQNNAELRATGGLIGCYGVVTADNGTFALNDFDKITTLQKNYDPIEAPRDFVDRYARFKSTSIWSNANMSPDFPTVSKVLLALYKSNTGQKLDGVISIDPIGLQYLLEAVGPVWVPKASANINASNVVDWTLVKAYGRYQENDRREFLLDVAEAVWKKLFSAQVSDWAKLIGKFSDALAGKHLILFSSDHKEQKVFVSRGYAGELKPTAGDFLQVLMQNHGANKIDVYLHEAIDCSVSLDANGLAHVKTVVTITNGAPKSGLPPIVAGNTPLGAKDGCSNTYLSVYVPKEAQLTGMTIDKGPGKPEVGYEKDKCVFSHYLTIAPGTNHVASFTYDIPGAMAVTGNKAAYILDCQVQPLIHPADLALHIKIPEGFSVTKLSDSLKKQEDAISMSKRLIRDERVEINLSDTKTY